MNNKFLSDYEISNDKHNTHDRTVNELSKKYYNIINSTTSIYLNNSDICEMIKELNIESNKSLVLNYFNFIIINKLYIVNFDCDEYDFFILCWNRACDNKKYCDNSIIYNIINNIIDCYTTYKDKISGIIVKKLCCLNGRIVKILSSFYMLDYENENLGSFISSDMIKKDFILKSSNIFKYIDNKDCDIQLKKYEYNKLLNNIIEEYDSDYKDILINLCDDIINSVIL